MENIISCIENIVEKSKGSKLSEDFWKESHMDISFLTKKLGLNKFQCLFISVLSNSEWDMTLTDLGKYFGVSRVGMLKYKSELDKLVEMRWLVYVDETNDERKCEVLGYLLKREALNAFANDESFSPESLKVKGIQQFVEKVASHFGEHIQGDYEQFRNDEAWINALMAENEELEICKAIKKYKPAVRIMLFCLISDFARYHHKKQDSIELEALKGICPNKKEQFQFECAMQRGSMQVMKDGYVEHKCGDGLAIPDGFVLTRKAREEWLSEYVANPADLGNHIKMIRKDIMEWSSIQKKELYYNPDEQEQVNLLYQILSEKELPNIQRRLEEKSMRKGITVLLSGSPGTGKTELVKQIAKTTRRNILSVDLGNIRSKWVGESEANVRRIFHNYEMLCKFMKDKCPILFINECDGLLGVRANVAASSIDKMNNTMQNILLEAIENTNGIVICTSNMPENLDKAFMRRFLFKVKFSKPNKDVREKIFSSLLPELKEEEIKSLATKYNITGGEIENISRKMIIDYVLKGITDSISQIETYCMDEQRVGKYRTVGF